MITKAAVILLALAIGGSVAAQSGNFGVQGQGLLVRFDGGIGVIPVSNGAGVENADGSFPNVTKNIVRNVKPAGGPWRIADLKAAIDVFGRVSIRGRGLLLASGNNIGLNGNQTVFATLICDTVAPIVEYSTTTTAVLEPNGNFRIDGALNPAPAGCASPVLLIRSAANNTWLAAGIQKFGDDN